MSCLSLFDWFFYAKMELIHFISVINHPYTLNFSLNIDFTQFFHQVSDDGQLLWPEVKVLAHSKV